MVLDLYALGRESPLVPKHSGGMSVSEGWKARPDACGGERQKNSKKKALYVTLPYNLNASCLVGKYKRDFAGCFSAYRITPA